MRGFADDSVDDTSPAGDPEARGFPGVMPTMEASSVSSQASYLEAVSSAIATMPPDALRQSLEYVLPPVVRMLRAETEALSVGDTGSSETETPKRRAARLEALESATRCVSQVMRRAGRCGASPEAALELFAALVSTLGKAVASVEAPVGDEKHEDLSSSALEHVRLASLDALRGALSVFDDDTTLFLVTDERNLPVLGYAISLLLDIARLEAEGKKNGARGGSRVVRREALKALAELVDAAARGERIKKEDELLSPSPSALAFFLPGVVSGCARAVAAAVGSRAGHGAGPASAAEDSAAAEAAAAALATICCASLADADFETGKRSKDLGVGAALRGDPPTDDASTANKALIEELRRLAKKKASDETREDVFVSSADTEVLEAEDEDEDETKRSKTLRVVRDAAWLKVAAPRVATAASSAFTQLVTHKKPSTRAAAALGALDVLETCGETLGSEARVAFLAAALVVSSDSFSVASDAVNVRLERLRSLESFVFFDATLERAFRESFRSMPKSVRSESSGFGGEGVARARSVAAALRWMDADSFADSFLADEGLRRDVSVALVSCFEMEPSTIGVSSVSLQENTQENGVTPDSRSRDGKNGRTDETLREVRARRARWLVRRSSRGEENGERVSDDDDDSRTSEKNDTVVPAPAPPPCTSFVSDAGLFANVARVARALGKNPVSLPALLETHLRATRETLAEARDAENEEAREGYKNADATKYSYDAPSAADAWRRKARAHVAVVVELLLGAAEARVESLGDKSSRPKRAFAPPTSSARSALEAFLGGGAWDLPTSAAAAAAAARRRRREHKERHRNFGTRARLERQRREGKNDGNADYLSDDTDASDEDETGASRKSVSPRFLATARENALLACLLIEAVGSVALACGPKFITTGGFLPAALCPLLLKLGDDDELVRETVEGVLFAVAVEGGFLSETKETEEEEDGSSGGSGNKTSDVSAAVSALVSKNADYVVDALSRRLRRLEAFPDAARFFAAVLGSGAGGAARDLLPFLRDPIARAAEAVSVAGRASFSPASGFSDDVACAFMRIMAQTSRAAAAEARATNDEIAEATKALEPLVTAMAKRGAATQNLDDDDDDDDARKFSSLSSTDVASLTQSLPACLASWRRRQTRLSRTSKLCAVMARAAAPLAESGDAWRRRLASEALASSLRACGFLASSFAFDKPVRDALRSLFPEEVPEDDGIPVEDRLVKVLPLIHEIWPHVVIGVMGQPRGPSLVPSAFEKSVDVLKACAEVSQPGNGGFISRRFLKDAWPGLLRALKQGVPSLDKRKDDITQRLERVALIDGKTMTASYDETNGASSLFSSAGASDGGPAMKSSVGSLFPDGIEPLSGVSRDSRASATVRTSVMSLLSSLASEEKTRESVTDVAPFALKSAVPFAIGEGTGSSPTKSGDNLSFKVRARAIDAVTALAAVDRDAAWMELASRATGRDDAPVPFAPRFVKSEEGQKKDKQNWKDAKGKTRDLPRLPSFRDISPVPQTRTAPGVAEAAARLLATVEGKSETELRPGGE